MNERYPIAAERDPDFDKPHPVAKCYGDGSIRHHCRCGRLETDPIHVPSKPRLPLGKAEK